MPPCYVSVIWRKDTEPKIVPGETDHHPLTLILQSADESEDICDQLMPLVYDELRKIAARQLAKESAGQTFTMNQSFGKR